jgi:hypothetical protein
VTKIANHGVRLSACKPGRRKNRGELEKLRRPHVPPRGNMREQP